MGKRYIDEAETLEVLCVKAGDGSLAANGALLLQKDTKNFLKPTRAAHECNDVAGNGQCSLS